MRMSTEMVVGYAVLWIVLFKALCMRAGIVRAECPRCGQVYERRELGGIICTCPR
jgi:transposase-like protein